MKSPQYDRVRIALRRTDHVFDYSFEIALSPPPYFDRFRLHDVHYKHPLLIENNFGVAPVSPAASELHVTIFTNAPFAPSKILRFPMGLTSTRPIQSCFGLIGIAMNQNS